NAGGVTTTTASTSSRVTSSRQSATKDSPCRSAKARPAPTSCLQTPARWHPGIPSKRCRAYRLPWRPSPTSPMPMLPDTLPARGFTGCLTTCLLHCYTYQGHRQTGGSIHGKDDSLSEAELLHLPPSTDPLARSQGQV